jgi:hypothetical protein
MSPEVVPSHVEGGFDSVLPVIRVDLATVQGTPIPNWPRDPLACHRTLELVLPVLNGLESNRYRPEYGPFQADVLVLEDIAVYLSTARKKRL